jgi:hypothetical protein
LCSIKWSNEKKKKGWKPFSSKKQLNTGLQGNEENGYPVPDLNKTVINDTKEPSNAHKTRPKNKSCKKSLRILWRRY